MSISELNVGNRV